MTPAEAAALWPDVSAVNRKLKALWEGTAEFAPELWPMVQGPEVEDGFLSVGLNPAFSNDDGPGWHHLRGVVGLERVLESPSTFFKWNPPDHPNFNPAMAVLVEKSAFERHRFFSPVRALRDSLLIYDPTLQWSHLDVFFIRKTAHLELDTVLFELTPEGGGPLALTDFGARQFELFERLMELSKPRIVVIYNLVASKLYLQARRETISYDDDLGCWLDTIAGRVVPVLFSGISTYLDQFSKRRLAWHARHVLRQLQRRRQAALANKQVTTPVV